MTKMNEKDSIESLLNDLDKTKIPPVDLEKRVIAKLTEQGEINKTARPISWMKSIAAALALLISSLLAFYAGKYSVLLSGQSDSAIAYMLLLKEDDGYISGDAEERFSEYALWMIGTADKGVSIDGQELSPESALVESGNKITHLSENQTDRVTGYFIIKTPSLDQAIDIANSCPHVKYGGKIDIKKIISQ